MRYGILIYSLCKQTNPTWSRPSVSPAMCRLMCSQCAHEFNFYCCIIKLFGVTSFWCRRPSDMCVCACAQLWNTSVYAFRQIFSLFSPNSFSIILFWMQHTVEFEQSKKPNGNDTICAEKQKCCNKMGLNSDVLFLFWDFRRTKFCCKTISMRETDEPCEWWTQTWVLSLAAMDMILASSCSYSEYSAQLHLYSGSFTQFCVTDS